MCLIQQNSKNIPTPIVFVNHSICSKGRRPVLQTQKTDKRWCIRNTQRSHAVNFGADNAFSLPTTEQWLKTYTKIATQQLRLQKKKHL